MVEIDLKDQFDPCGKIDQSTSILMLHAQVKNQFLIKTLHWQRKFTDFQRISRQTRSIGKNGL